MAESMRAAVDGGRLPGVYDSEYAELYAIYKALRMECERGDPRGRKVIVVSDALSMLEAVESAYWGARVGGWKSVRAAR